MLMTLDCFFSGEELMGQLHEKQEFYHFLMIKSFFGKAKRGYQDEIRKIFMEGQFY